MGAASATAATPHAFAGAAPHAGTTVTKAAALGDNWYAAAPYLMPLDNDPPDAGSVMDATGMKAFQLAFILAPTGGGCTPTWGGTDAVSSDTQVTSVINAIRAKGGDVSVSVGGYGGTKLGQECGSASATAAAYQQVVTKYGLHAIDFDLEEPEYENTAAIANELGAAQILQQSNPGLYISVTTPGTAAGTGWFGTQMLDEAKSLGFTPNNFSIMPFDGGFSGAASQTAALTAFNQILQTTFGWDAATAYAHEGYSGMNGRSDSGEYFYQADFQTVLNFAESNHMARYTFWSVNRDRECSPPDNNGTTSGTCSSVTQGAYDFTKFATQFAGATPPSSPTPPPTSPPPGGGTCTVAAYSATAVYTAGNQVSYNGHVWTAKWWTQGEAPSTGGSGVWTDDGSC
ncbi:chitinase [Streptomyces sp. SL13]|uniref:Chitinase n=1 Tax=Streptantibioticus silvisoli TaxID=2705255 RepID=A0AA90K9S6_9ACTN|nr:carbohydrate-binding protein [Streptantibioticus silvisoli]MDI5966777.1 chitinase [Streptantibioticus silvisoli]MDI5971202.1 chitinase [Streptantibioticus silvisoli]